MMESNEVILVNEADEQLGTMEKMEAHRKGLLHRAFSVFIFNPRGEMLLQQRAAGKYHSPGLWTNACCSHPRPGEQVADAAGRRLREELGFDAPLEKIFTFIYETPFDNGLTEHEVDHVFAGIYEDSVKPDPGEVQDYTYKPVDEIEYSLSVKSSAYTSWFRIAFPRVRQWAETKFGIPIAQH